MTDITKGRLRKSAFLSYYKDIFAVKPPEEQYHAPQDEL